MWRTLIFQFHYDSSSFKQIRPRFKLRKIPLVHYPQPQKKFRLQFIRLRSHAFLSKVVLGAPKDCYILVPALGNDNGEYELTDFTTSQLTPIRQNVTSNQRKVEKVRSIFNLPQVSTKPLILHLFRTYQKAV